MDRKLCGNKYILGNDRKDGRGMKDFKNLYTVFFYSYIFIFCRTGNELQEARSSEDDLDHPPVKKTKREIAEDNHGQFAPVILYQSIYLVPGGVTD